MMRNRFAVLLVGLLLLFLWVALASLLSRETQVATARFVFAGLSVALLLAALNAVSASRRSFRIGLALFTPAIVLSTLDVFSSRDDVSSLRYAITAIAFGFTIAAILQLLFRPQLVNANLVCASLCGYLLIGVLWANLFSLIDVLHPNSFQYSTELEELEPKMRFEGPEASFAVYYSFVTLTTLGYGDVVPRSAPARLLAAFEAVLGQIYLAVLVARLVGLHVARQGREL